MDNINTTNEIDIFSEERRSKKFFKQKKNLSETDKQLLELYQNSNIQNAQVGQSVNVTFIGTNAEHFMFDGGFKDYVRVDNKSNEAKYLKNTEIGENIEVMIVEVDQDNFIIKGSIATIYETKIHETLKTISEDDENVVGLIKEMTPAGYSVEIYYDGVTLDGFMPNTLAGINKLHEPESIIGQKMELMIESYSREEGTYIVSRRKYLQSLIPVAIKALENGVVYSGHVTGTTEFGVFVEFNECLTGMIHKTNLNPAYQDKIAEIKPGILIDFYIKEIIKDSKIILTQILRDSLWDTIKIGQILDGRVKDNKQFGALIILDDETIGLIHTSEIEKTRQVKTGENVKVKVISVDRMNRKIFLSLVN